MYNDGKHESNSRLHIAQFHGSHCMKGQFLAEAEGGGGLILVNSNFVVFEKL